VTTDPADRSHAVEEPAAHYLYDEADALIKLQGARIRDLRSQAQLTIDDVHQATGLHTNTIGRIERGQAEASISQLLRIARAIGVAPARLMHYASDDVKGERGLAFTVQKNLRAVEVGEFVYVPHFEIQASAGRGALFNQIETVKAMRPFDQAYIRGELGIRHDEIVLIDVNGNSMEPILHSRDTAMVDLRSTEVYTEGVHVIRLDSALLVKKVQRLPGKVLRISSENEDYAPFEIKGTEDADRDFQIIGRVVWGGVTIK
jgi:phage repressor protein C with HTH and peptisase S24 domain